MRVLSQCSFVASFVLVVSLFDGLSAAKTTKVSLTSKVLAEIGNLWVTVKDEIHPLNVVQTLAEVAVNHKTALGYVVDAYNAITFGGEVPTPLVNDIPKPILNVICTEENEKYLLNGEVISAVGTLMKSIGDQIIAAKGGNTRKYCGGWKCCGGYCCGTPQSAPSVLRATVGLLGTVLKSYAESYFTKDEGPKPESIDVAIPNEHISFGYLDI